LGDVLSEGGKNPRLAVLRAFAAQRPQDPFPRFGLGMELKSAGDLQGAWEAFETLVAEHPDYIACYAPAGEVLVALGRVEDARGIYGKGIEACARKGDAHMGANLEDALAALVD
jgi:tetratricopeptide (TPR) repeat protein